MQSRDNVMMTHIVRSISKPKTDLVLQSLYEFWFVVPRPSKPNFLLRVSNIFKHLQKLISASAIIILSRHNEQSSVPTRHDSNPFGSQWGSWLLTYSHLLHACNIYKHVHPKSSTSKELFQHHETYVPWSMVKSQALVWGIVTAPSKSSMAYHGQYAPLFHWSLAEFMACLAWSSLMVWCFSSRSDVTWPWLIHNHTNKYHNVLLEIYSWLVMYVPSCTDYINPIIFSNPAWITWTKLPPLMIPGIGHQVLVVRVRPVARSCFSSLAYGNSGWYNYIYSDTAIIIYI